MSLQTNLEKLPASQYAILVTLSFGSGPTVYRYCRWSEDIIISGETFVAEPLLDVELGESHGGTEDKPHKLTLPRTREPFKTMSLGFAFPKVHAKIEQVDPTSPTTRRHLGEGDVSITTKNPGGRTGMVRGTASGIKSRIAEVSSLSLRLTSTCDIPFGGSRCRVNSSAWTRSGTISGISRNVVTLSIPSVSDPVAELPNARYRRGYIEVDALRILVKKSLEDFTFELFEVVPPYWMGASFLLRAGCDKRLETCRLWNNEANFMALGIKIPPRNPLYQEA